MKIVFFDVDKLTGQYLKTRPACKCNIILLENSIETMTDEQYEQLKMLPSSRFLCILQKL